MYVKTSELTKLVRNRKDAQEVIADLLVRFAGESAYERLEDDAKFAKQSVEEAASRTAGNFLNSFVVRKPGGWVY
jgi:hypothetical protein